MRTVLLNEISDNFKDYTNSLVIKKTASRSVTMRINNRGEIILNLPPFISYQDGFDFIKRKENWLKKHLLKFERAKNYFLFGKKMEIRSGDNYLTFLKDNKIIKMVSGAPEDAESIYEQMVLNEAIVYIPDRVRTLASKYSFEFNRVLIKNQATRWGSCSSKKNLSFNYQLVKYSEDLIDYVIIHELCHLREMNHSQRFWQLVQNFIPDYKMRRFKIKNRIME